MIKTKKIQKKKKNQNKIIIFKIFLGKLNKKTTNYFIKQMNKKKKMKEKMPK